MGKLGRVNIIVDSEVWQKFRKMCREDFGLSASKVLNYFMKACLSKSADEMVEILGSLLKESLGKLGKEVKEKPEGDS